MALFLRNSVLVRRVLLSILIFVIIATVALYRLNTLNQKPLSPENFSTWNKIEIYSLGLAMGLVAYPLYPEVSKEHLMLYTPFEGEPKIVEDDFFLKSKIVLKTLHQVRNSKKEERLWWPMTAYTFSFSKNKYWESRISLALNGGWLSVNKDEVRVRVPVRYPKRAFAPLIKLPYIGTIGVQEGLFNILQEEGWLHPGEVIWVAKIGDETK